MSSAQGQDSLPRIYRKPLDIASPLGYTTGIMEKIILEVLAKYADMGVNLASEGARHFLARDIELALQSYMSDFAEGIVTPVKDRPTPKQDA